MSNTEKTVKPAKRRKHKPRLSGAELQAAIEANKKIYYSHFDMNFVRALNREFFVDLMGKAYFRPEFIGFEERVKRNNPDHPVILASNHSGMAFPWDAMVFGALYYHRFGYDPKNTLRPLAAPMLSQTPIMHPFIMLDAWKVAGGIDATYLNFETMMHYPNGELLYYPEGVPGIGKGFNRKYQLQRIASSFIRMSLKYKTDVVFYSTINAEYVVPFMYSIGWIDRLFQKAGIPFMPMGPLTILLLLQPWTFYLAFPVKMRFVEGSRISPSEMTDKPFEELTEADIEEIRNKVHALMQADLTAAKEKYGKKPYDWGSFFKEMGKNLKDFPYNLPLGWPFVFAEFERQWFKKGGGRDGKPVKIYKGWGAIFLFIFRNPITIAYFIPVIGWFFLVLWGKWKWGKEKKRRKQMEA